MRILILAPEMPFPPVSGGQLRTYHLLRSLAARHALTLVGFVWQTASAPPPFPVRVVDVPWDWPAAYKAMKFADADASRRAVERLSDPAADPWFVSCYESEAMDEVLRGLRLETFDLVLLEHTMMAR